jgi:hypothetical protein
MAIGHGLEAGMEGGQQLHIDGRPIGALIPFARVVSEDVVDFVAALAV